MTQTSRVAVVEDDPTTRVHLENTIAQAEGLTLAWSADSLSSAQKLATDLPALILLDLGLPDGNGAELVATLRSHATQQDLPMPKVLVVTVFDDRRSVLHAVQSGADGYLIKHSDRGQITQAIGDLLQGGAPLSSGASVHLTEAIRQHPTLAAPEAEPRPALTRRERDVLNLLAKGLSYRQTGVELGISLHTVGDFVKAIYRKLGVNSRAEAVYRGLREDIVRL